jgi:predicted dehydrogenase
MYRTHRHSSRRDFLKSSVAFGALTILPSYIALGKQSSTGLPPSERVNVALVGIGNRGNRNWAACMKTGLCNIVALCDVDLKGAHTQAAQKRFSRAQTFTDFRKMFDTMADAIDAVIVSTPDHAHFAVTMLAMSLGKHVYCEKPLTHTFGQCERIMDLATRSGVATQMGNHGFSGPNYFQFKAWREAGLIKEVSRITAHMNQPRLWYKWKPQDDTFPNDAVPDGLDWDQWMDAVATIHPYSTKLHPKNWRAWYDYGSGCLGDWGPHILDSSHHFLELGLPTKISAINPDENNRSEFIYPKSSTICFNFPQRGPDLPACTVTWYDGTNNQPTLENEYCSPIIGSISDKTNPQGRKLKIPGKVIYSKDFVFQGQSHASALRIVPEAKYIDIRQSLPRFTQRNSNHYGNFLLACKGEEKTRSPFSISGPLTQVLHLGILAQRLGGEIHFDRNSKQVTNNKVAQALLDPAPRKGWEEFYAL